MWSQMMEVSVVYALPMVLTLHRRTKLILAAKTFTWWSAKLMPN